MTRCLGVRFPPLWFSHVMPDSAAAIALAMNSDIGGSPGLWFWLWFCWFAAPRGGDRTAAEGDGEGDSRGVLDLLLLRPVGGRAALGSSFFPPNTLFSQPFAAMIVVRMEW